MPVNLPAARFAPFDRFYKIV